MKGLKTRKTIQFPQIFSIKRIAATPVVELPVNGSMIKSPSFVLAKMILSNRANGFWIGCLLKIFLL